MLTIFNRGFGLVNNYTQLRNTCAAFSFFFPLFSFQAGTGKSPVTTKKCGCVRVCVCATVCMGGFNLELEGKL